MSRTVTAPTPREFIRGLAAFPDGVGKHAAFIRAALHEPLFDTAIMARAMDTTPLTEASMLYIAEHWSDVQVTP